MAMPTSEPQAEPAPSARSKARSSCGMNVGAAPTLYTRAANCGIYAKQIGNIPKKTGWQLTCFANFSALGP
jgi:hypothetical protein